jgi:hypothetical protein
LSLVLADLGRLPEALARREESLALRRKLGLAASVPYDLLGKADLFARLGRLDEAERTLAEFELAVSREDAAFQPLRAYMYLSGARLDLVKNRPERALPRLARAERATNPDDASARVIASALRAVALARLRRPSEATALARASWEEASVQSDASLLMDVGLLAVEASALAGDQSLVSQVADALRGLPDLDANAEVGWRLEAMRALSTASDAPRPELTAPVLPHLSRLKGQLGSAYASYIARPDIATLHQLLGPI